jgi:hypothetical protein
VDVEAALDQARDDVLDSPARRPTATMTTITFAPSGSAVRSSRRLSSMMRSKRRWIAAASSGPRLAATTCATTRASRSGW